MKLYCIDSNETNIEGGTKTALYRTNEDA